MDCLTLKSLISQAYNDNKFWELLLNDEAVQAGPFDGGCLVCAEALHRMSAGGLAYIAYKNVATHYGVMVDGVYFDFYGMHASGKQWLHTFSDNERVDFNSLTIGHGRCSKNTDIPFGEHTISMLVEYFNTLKSQ